MPFTVPRNPSFEILTILVTEDLANIKPACTFAVTLDHRFTQTQPSCLSTPNPNPIPTPALPGTLFRQLTLTASTFETRQNPLQRPPSSDFYWA
jgi:hypothetical protein